MKLALTHLCRIHFATVTFFSPSSIKIEAEIFTFFLPLFKSNGTQIEQNTHRINVHTVPTPMTTESSLIKKEKRNRQIYAAHRLPKNF